MKRALIVGGGTLAGVAAVLALNPDGATTPLAAATVSSSSSAGGTAGSTGSGSTSGTSTVTGTSVDVGHGYGSMQVEITVTDGRLVDITALEIPQNDPRSYQISSRALPTLVEQALAAQSGDIAGVSGASYTSYGFVESLRAALSEAGLAS